jgi:uncharacterized spore protein YtfJ
MRSHLFNHVGSPIDIHSLVILTVVAIEQGSGAFGGQFLEFDATQTRLNRNPPCTKGGFAGSWY